MKWIGAGIVIAVCSWFGFSCAAAQKAEEKALRQLASILDYIGCELQYRLTALPELCKQAASEGKGIVYRVFSLLAEELEAQVAPDAMYCMHAAIAHTKNIPPVTKSALLSLGQSMGKFDLAGQLKGLEAVRGFCREELDKLTENREPRLRSYQTLGVCAGAALVILFI